MLRDKSKTIETAFPIDKMFGTVSVRKRSLGTESYSPVKLKLRCYSALCVAVTSREKKKKRVMPFPTPCFLPIEARKNWLSIHHDFSSFHLALSFYSPH